MALSDIDLSPGFVTQLSVTPTLHETTDQGIRTHVDHSILLIITNKIIKSRYKNNHQFIHLFIFLPHDGDSLQKKEDAILKVK